MDPDVFKTISEPSEGFFKDKLSKFYAYAFPVKNEEEIKEIRTNFKKKFHTSKHQVYAYILGKEKEIYRYSDDGEPNNSSGPPIYNAIKSFDLTDILIIVIRYFGGKKLGIPGLINAYRTAAKDALKNAKIIEKIALVELNLEFNFKLLNKVMHDIKKMNLNIVSQNFTDKCKITINVNVSKKEEISNFFSNFDIKIN